VLNSRTEYSRCRLPRLTINHEEWEKNKIKEKAQTEAIDKETVKICSGMEEDKEFLMAGGVVLKRKNPIKPSVKSKKRKLEILEDWGEKSSKSEGIDIRNWLITTSSSSLE
jgi:hypothetical protein